MAKKSNVGEKKEETKETTDLLEPRFIDWETVAPSRRFFELWNEMDKMMDEFWGARHIGKPMHIMAELGKHIPRLPALDIVDAGNEYHLDIEMPGIRKEDVKIEVSDNSIEISAETVKDDKKEGKNYMWRERHSGRFHRILPLPRDVQADKVDAQMEHGVLKVILPKKAARSSKKKKVSVK